MKGLRVADMLAGQWRSGKTALTNFHGHDHTMHLLSRAVARAALCSGGFNSVSYTQLTLPTLLLV